MYRPYEQRTVDYQYHNLLKRLHGLLVQKGAQKQSAMDESSVAIYGDIMRFELVNGFPAITERDLSDKLFTAALGEHMAFLNGARTHAQLSEFGCTWWKPWVSEAKCKKRGLEAGDLGPGSYGPAWRNFPTSDPFTSPFDQISHLIQQIEERPELRTHLVVPWIPQYIGRTKDEVQRVVVVPCHGELFVFVDTVTRELTVVHVQRSADAPVGLVFNLIQYAFFTMALAQVTGYIAKELVYQLVDVHMYESQREAVEELLSREPRPFPTVTIDRSVSSLFDFRPHHVTLSDYDPHPAMRIPTPV